MTEATRRHDHGDDQDHGHGHDHGHHHHHTDPTAHDNIDPHPRVTAGLALETVRPVLRVYYRALADRNVHLIPVPASEEIPPDSDTTIRLPAGVDRFPIERDNFLWYKVALTHRAVHYEAGTYAFQYLKPAARFERMRVDGEGGPVFYPEDTDLVRFFRHFSRRALAREIFLNLEDFRVDLMARGRYPGLRSAYERVQQQALAERPDLATMPPRNALAEILVRLSLEADACFDLPRMLHDPAKHLYRVITELRAPDAGVEDVAEATMRTYSLITQLPNLEADYGPATPVDLSAPSARAAQWYTAWPEPEAVRLEGDSVLDVEITPVGYREKLGTRYMDYKAGGPFAARSIYHMKAVEGQESGMAVSEADPPREAHAQTNKKDEPLAPRAHEHGPHEIHHGHPLDHNTHHDVYGKLKVDDPDTYVYPEWDHVAGQYRPEWCLVRERRLETAGVTQFYRETLRANQRLVSQISRQLELMTPEGLRKVRRASHGEDLDLDACVEAIVDRRAGVTPSDFIYSSRARVHRDVAVAFVIDLSMSTAEQVERPTPPPGAEDDGAALRASHLRAALRHGKPTRSILDVEKESICLLMAALERVGDTYGIYGFSGTGRDNLQFVLIKEMQERLSDQVIGRVENLRPIHTTRMGPALRHAVRKLRGQEAATKLLVLVSDGRPFDHGYGQEYGEGGEIAYAIHDTRQALDEARKAGVNPFVLTVDPNGQDYLRTMCEDLSYEVLPDVNLLPARLLSLYRRLTARR